MAVTFTPSQLSYKDNTSPINFRISPLKLLWSDLNLVPSLIATLPQWFLPLRTTNPRGELNPRTPGNIVTIVLHTLIGIGTLVGIIGSLVLVFLPFPLVGFALYVAIIIAICTPGKVSNSKPTYKLGVIYLNWGPEVVISDPSLLSQVEQSSFKQEKWFFINGILTGDDWLNSAIDELSFLFKRKVYGIRNRTSGLFCVELTSIAEVFSLTWLNV